VHIFIIWTRPKSNRTNHTGIKVVNTLTRAEHEVSRSELVPLLQHQLREQKRADGATIGLDQGLRPGSISTREPGTSDNVHLSLPLDRKHPKHNKKIMLDKAIKVAEAIEQQFHSGAPLIAIHVPSSSFDSMLLHPDWWREGESEALKAVLDSLPSSASYVQQIRESIQKKRGEGSNYLILLSLRDDRLQLINFS